MPPAMLESVMDCDAVVLLNGGPGAKTVVEKDGILGFEFPGDTKPVTKITNHDCTLQPWFRQATKGTPIPAKSVIAGESAKIVYDQYLKDAPAKLITGQNLLVVSYGDDQSKKRDNILGSSSSDTAIVHHFLEGLFATPGIEDFNVALTAYAVDPTSLGITDLFAEDGGSAGLRDADAKRAGADLVGLENVIVKKADDIKGDMERLLQHVNTLREKEISDVEKRAEQMSLRREVKSEAGEALDLGFDSPKSQDESKSTVESYIPEPFQDQLVVVSVKVFHGDDPKTTGDRKSATWGLASFFILPDCTRPQAVGALRSEDVVRYEKVQKMLCALFAILTAIRLKRRRIPFLMHRFTSTLRILFRQVGEHEQELKLIKDAAFRATQQLTGPSSPHKGGDPPSTRAIVLMHLPQQTEPLKVLENFHIFTCVKRFCEMASGNVTGLFTRHLQTEQAQMDREIASLTIQLEVAKSVHNYRPVLCGVKSKEMVSVAEREKAALEKRGEALQAAEAEKQQRIRDSASHIADRNIQEERSRMAQVQQLHSDCIAKHKQLEKDLAHWVNLSIADLQAEIRTLTADVGNLEGQAGQLEKKKAELRKRSDDKKAEMGRMAAQMAEKQRKVLDELEKKKAEARKIADGRKAKVRSGVAEIRNVLVNAGRLVAEEADRLGNAQAVAKPACANIKEGIAGLENILARLIPDEPTDDQRTRIEQVAAHLAVGWTHELLHMQRTLREHGVPLPVYPSSKQPLPAPVDVCRPPVRVILTFEGMTGVMDEREMKYSIAAVRSGKVQESARRFRNKSGVVEWHQQMKFTTRLPGQGNVGADFVTFTLVEFLPEGSTSEALPFDVDILAMACKPGQYVISPCKDASLRISIHARTVKLRPKRAKANPLCTAKQIRTEKHIDIPYGPSSDEED